MLKHPSRIPERFYISNIFLNLSTVYTSFFYSDLTLGFQRMYLLMN